MSTLLAIPAIFNYIDNKRDGGTDCRFTNQAQTKSPTEVLHPITGQSIGTVSYVRIGTRDECQSICCRLHRCKAPMKRTAQGLAVEGIKHWFRRGLEECLEGPEGKHWHNAMFYTCLTEYR